MRNPISKREYNTTAPPREPLTHKFESQNEVPCNPKLHLKDTKAMQLYSTTKLSTFQLMSGPHKSFNAPYDNRMGDF
jgi:hypothetical protein